MGMNIADVQRFGPGAQRQIYDALRGAQKGERERSEQGRIPHTATVIDGHRFDSKAEAERYMVLRQRERDGEITDLRIHPAFRLTVNGIDVCDYVADFSYFEDCRIVEDVKSKPSRTPVYKLKRKLLWALERIEVREV